MVDTKITPLELLLNYEDKTAIREGTSPQPLATAETGPRAVN